MNRLINPLVAAMFGVAVAAPVSAAPNLQIETLGFTGAGYEYSTLGGLHRYSAVEHWTPSVLVSGRSARYTAAGVGRGQDAWVYDGSALHQIGFTGADYELAYADGAHRYSRTVGFDSTGLLYGETRRYHTPETLGTNVDQGYEAWVWDGATTTRVGFYGGSFDWTLDDGYTHRISRITHVNGAYAAGYSVRFGGELRFPSTESIGLGASAWIYNGITTREVGLFGSEYETITDRGVIGGNQMVDLNASGQTVGYARRNPGEWMYALGQDAWYDDGSASQLIGLTGAGYEYAAAKGTYRSNTPVAVSASGHAFGIAKRFSASGTALGNDVWAYDGTTTRLISLAGSDYERQYSDGLHRTSSESSIVINSAGRAVGTTDLAGSNGNDVWFYDGSTSRRVGFIGDGYEKLSNGNVFRRSTVSLGEAGLAYGASHRYRADGSFLGEDAWTDDGVTTRRAGLTGTGYEFDTGDGVTRLSRFTTVMTDTGYAGGFSYRYSSTGVKLGEDAWIDNGTTATYVGLQKSGYTNLLSELDTPDGTVRHSRVSKVNDAGQAIGTSARWGSLRYGVNLGQDAWFFDGQTSVALSLSGRMYRRGDGYASSTPGLLNERGQVVGINARFDPQSFDHIGHAAWFYDSTTEQLTELLFSVRDDGYAWTDVQLLAETGELLGWYELFDGSTSLGRRAFWWDLDEGMIELGSLAGNFTDEGWRRLADIIAANGTDYIIGHGLLTGMSGGLSGGQMAYLLTPVPEPTSLIALTLSAGLLLRRRRR